MTKSYLIVSGCCVLLANVASAKPIECELSLPNTFSLEVLSNDTTTKADQRLIKQLNGYEIVTHPDSWAPKINFNITWLSEGYAMVNVSISQSKYEQTENGASYEYLTEALCDFRLQTSKNDLWYNLLKQIGH
jgi:hypothetical protein